MTWSWRQERKAGEDAEELRRARKRNREATERLKGEISLAMSLKEMGARIDGN